MLREDDVLQDAILIHQLVDEVTGRHLDRERDGGLVTGAHHPHCGRALDHLDLGAQLEADSLALMHVEVDSMLASAGGCCYWLLLCCRLATAGYNWLLMAAGGGLLTTCWRPGGCLLAGRLAAAAA